MNGKFSRKYYNVRSTVLFHFWCTRLSLQKVQARWPHGHVVRTSPNRAVRFRTLAETIVLFSWERYLTLTVRLSTQVYKWVAGEFNARGNPAKD